MRVGESGRRDQQRSGLGRDFSALVEKLRFAGGESVVEVDRPQHDPMQRLAVVALGVGVQLAMPIRVASLVGQIFLQIDAAGPEQLENRRVELGIVQRCHALRVEGFERARDRVGNLQAHRPQHRMGKAAQVAAQAHQHRVVQQLPGVGPQRIGIQRDVPAVFHGDVHPAAGHASLRTAAGLETLDQCAARTGVEHVVVDLDEIGMDHGRIERCNVMPGDHLAMKAGARAGAISCPGVSWQAQAR